MKLAFYQGPVEKPRASWSNFRHFCGHWAIRIGTFSRFSHVELVIDGSCWSSSALDGGVREKEIDLNTGRWVVFDVPEGLDTRFALAWFRAHEGEPYDWAGIYRFICPWVKQKPRAYFCSEAVACALDLPSPTHLTPQDLYAWVSFLQESRHA